MTGLIDIFTTSPWHSSVVSRSELNEEHRVIDSESMYVAQGGDDVNSVTLLVLQAYLETSLRAGHRLLKSCTFCRRVPLHFERIARRSNRCYQKVSPRYLYYYSSPVRKICPQHLTNFYPRAPNSTAIISWIFLRLHLANLRSLCDHFLRLSFVFFTTKNHKQRPIWDESVSICVIDQVRSANDDPNALLQINR